MATYRPMFFYKNRITDESQVTEGTATSATLRRKLFDRNKGTKYLAGDNDGTLTLTWTPSASTPINAIAIQNTNIKAFTIKYNGSSDFSVPISVTENSEKHLFWFFNTVSVTSITITVTETTDGSRAFVGQLLMLEQIFEWASNYFDEMRRIAGGRSILTELSDGAYFKTFIRECVHYEIRNEVVPEEEKEKFEEVYELNRRETFVFIDNPKMDYDNDEVESYIVDGSGDMLVDGSGNFVVDPVNPSWDGYGAHYHWGNHFDFINWYNDLEKNGFIANIELYQASGVS